MYSTDFKKVAQVIILMCLISFAVVNCEKYSQFSNHFKNVQIRAKRNLSIQAPLDLAQKLYKEREHQAKEYVTDNYKAPEDPLSYG
uniref:Lipoprotein n=1 Tax=Strongyloides venezuelensis TaxID=75913 RepID=A0A0K0G3J0_STRVS